MVEVAVMQEQLIPELEAVELAQEVMVVMLH
jgi:hypothetical protein